MVGRRFLSAVDLGQEGSLLLFIRFRLNLLSEHCTVYRTLYLD